MHVIYPVPKINTRHLEGHNNVILQTKRVSCTGTMKWLWCKQLIFISVQDQPWP